MDAWVVWVAIASVGVIAAGLVVTRVMSKEAQVHRGLNRLPTLHIKAVPDGKPARVEGRLKYAGEPVEAPLSGRRCAFYAVKVEIHVEGKGWMPLIQEERGTDFWLEDETGKVYVEAGAGKIVATDDAGLHSDMLKPERAKNAEAFLARHGHKVGGELGLGTENRYRFFEGVLEEGETVNARGIGVHEADPKGGYRKKLRAPRGGHVLVSEDPTRGQSINETYKV